MFTRVRIPTVSKRRTQARRACLTVLCAVAAFVALQLSLGVGVETVLPEIRDPLYGRRLHHVRRRLDALPSKPLTVVMLGSSRALNGFLPKGREEGWSQAAGRPVLAFNFAMAARGPLTELLTCRRLLRDGVRPDLLLVEATPFFLDSQFSGGELTEETIPGVQLPWQDLSVIERYAGNARPGLKRAWLRSALTPWYTHRLRVMRLAAPDLLPWAYQDNDYRDMDDHGALPFPTVAPTPGQRLLAQQKAQAVFQPCFAGFHLGGPGCEALRELLAYCRRKGVPVALVLMPEGPAFRGWYPPETWRSIQEWVDQVGREYDAPVVNARDWIDEDDFMDSHHLLAHGAARFTERLGREYIVPLLRRSPDQTAAASP